MTFLKRVAIGFGFLFFVSTITQACPTPEFVRQVNQCKRQQIDYSDGILLVKHLQRAMKAGRVLEVSDYISFPLRVNGSKGHFTVASRDAFVDRYASIFTHSVKRKISAADPNDIFCNYQGGTVGDGVIWFQEKDHLKVYVINQ